MTDQLPMDEPPAAQEAALVNPHTGEVLPADLDAERQLRAKFAAKIARCYDRISNLPKDAKHPNQGYSYTSAQMLFAAGRAAMAVAGLALLPIPGERVEYREIRTSNGVRGDHLIQHFTMLLIDCETGYEMAIPWYGESYEYQDKGFNKCQTAAIKSLIKTLFIVPTGDPADDPDSGPHEAEQGRGQRAEKPLPKSQPRPAAHASQRSDPTAPASSAEIKAAGNKILRRLKATAEDFAAIQKAVEGAGLKTAAMPVVVSLDEPALTTVRELMAKFQVVHGLAASVDDLAECREIAEEKGLRVWDAVANVLEGAEVANIAALLLLLSEHEAAPGRGVA